MSEASYDLSELIEVSRNGTDFYEEVAKKVGDKKLSKAFAQMALAKSCLANELSNGLKPAKPRRGKAEAEPMIELRRAYGDLRREISKIGLSHISLLEQTEGFFQSSVQKVVMDRGNSCVVRVSAKQYVTNAETFKSELRAKKRDLG